MIKSERVTEIFMNCLFTDEEMEVNPTPEKFTPAYGVITNVGFHPERIEQSREEVCKILQNFSDEFYSDKGQGFTFLKFVLTKDGTQWTDLHRVADQLICLGSALGVITLTPEEFNVVAPGGVPYVTINSSVFEFKVLDLE